MTGLDWESGDSPMDETRHRFFVVSSGALLAIVVAGFSPSFFLKVFFETPELPFYLHLHGVLLTAWFTLLFVQTALISSKRVDLHRRLGVAGVILIVPIVIVGVVTSALAVPRMAGLAGPEGAPAVIAESSPIVFMNFALLPIVGIVVACGAYFRRRPEVHKRCMLLASLMMVDPAIDRLWRMSGDAELAAVAFPLTFIVLLVTVVGFDWYIHRRPPWVLLGGLAVSFPIVSTAGAYGATEAAQSWLLSLG